jgi:hypothetical protein
MATPVSLLVVVLAIPLGFLIFLMASIRRNKRLAERLFGEGVSFIKVLRSLLTMIQQHRGLTTGYINGNRASKADIDLLDNNIKRLMVEIPAISNWMVENNKWSSLVDHWRRLSQAYLQGDSENNFKQHNILIANLLYLIEDVADFHHLTKLGGGSMDTDWRYLLSVAEYIGQARALGTGVAAKGECSSVLRIQLNHLHNKIKSSIDSSWSEKSRKEIMQLLDCIETQLIVSSPNIEPGDYFKLATRCIDHVLIQFDKQIDQLQFFRN